jgi:hypothetical protein
MRSVTAATITDEQIIALGEDPRSSLTTRAWCIAAMRIIYGASKNQLRHRRKARARVAEILNRRGER